MTQFDKFIQSLKENSKKMSPIDFAKMYFSDPKSVMESSANNLNPEETRLLAYVQAITTITETETLTKVIGVEEDLLEILKNTKNKIFFRKPPYPLMFLDNEFSFVADKENILVRGLIIADAPNNEQKFLVLGIGFDSKFNPIQINFVVEDTFIGMKEQKNMAELVCNILDLLNEKRDITYYSKVYDTVQEQKRASKGKAYRQNKTIIKAHGSLKILCSEVNSVRTKYTLNCSYVVRGHFRHFKAERFNDKLKNTQVWIKPFLKGKGEFVKKKIILK